MKVLTESEIKIENKMIKIFKSEKASAPIVYANMFEDEAEEILSECEKLNSKPFHFVSVTGLRWDGELSPWQSGPVITKNDKFTGEAENYMRLIETKIIPFAEENITPEFRVIAGYSMGGLFALYAPYISDAFSGVVSASGSVWFPGFVKFVRENGFCRTPDAVYLSLGDKESKSKNGYLSTVQACTEEIYSIYKNKSFNTVFELNPGNHFKDPSYRLAKGIVWALNYRPK